MKTKTQDLWEELKIRIKRSELEPEQLIREASSIVVFGSRAARVESPWSDMDVLFVGAGERKKTKSLDLLWRTESELNSEWLGSELATHIAEYGVPLMGQMDWAAHVYFGEAAREYKRRRIASILAHVSLGWARLHLSFRKRYQTTVRRELQRFTLLATQVPIPPTPNLDSEWRLNPKLTCLLDKGWTLDQIPVFERLLLAEMDELRRDDLFASLTLVTSPKIKPWDTGRSNTAR